MSNWFGRAGRATVIAAAFGCGFLYSAAAQAAPQDENSVLLGKTELRTASGTATAELWGEPLKGGYNSNLLVLLKDGADKVLTAYKPSINGGYNCLLQAVQVKPVKKNMEQADKDKLPQQLLLSVAQGDWRARTEYRVLDFSAGGRARELFGAEDSMGIVSRAVIAEKNLHIQLHDDEEQVAPLVDGFDLGNSVDFGGLVSLIPHDFDEDGQQELLSVQQLASKRQTLADVGAIWRLQPDSKPLRPEKDAADEQEHAKPDDALDAGADEKPELLLPRAGWKQTAITIMTASPVAKGNTVNDGLDFAAGAVLPRRAVVPGGEATYPVFAAKNIELQDKVNAVLQQECKEYLERFYQNRGDMAFKIMRADDRVLSVQLISSGGKNFLHHNVNIDMRDGKLLTLGDVLNLKDRDLPQVLNVLKTHDKLDFTKHMPEEWYFEEDNLFLMERVDDKDEIAGFALGNLHKYLRIPVMNIINKKTD